MDININLVLKTFSFPAKSKNRLAGKPTCSLISGRPATEGEHNLTTTSVASQRTHLAPIPCPRRFWDGSLFTFFRLLAYSFLNFFSAPSFLPFILPSFRPSLLSSAGLCRVLPGFTLSVSHFSVSHFFFFCGRQPYAPSRILTLSVAQGLLQSLVWLQIQQSTESH